MKAALVTFLMITVFLFAGGVYAQGVSPIGFGSDLAPTVSVNTNKAPQYIVGQATQPGFDVRQLLTSGFLLNALTVGATVIGLFFLVNRSSLTLTRIFGGLVVVATAALTLLQSGAEAARHVGCGGSLF